MNVRAVLIDDEKHNLENLRELLSVYCPQVTVCDTALNAEDGKTIILKQEPEIVFLDIQMPGQTGFDLLKGLKSYDFEVIFVTAHDQYAIQAMRMSAIDYLLKPIDIGELQSAVDNAIKQYKQKAQNRQLENLIDLLKSQRNKDEQRVALPTTKETRFVRTSEIVRCESSNNYSTFFLADGESMVVCKPIYEYEEILKDFGFIRCHQSHLVNKKFIKSWKKDYGDHLLLYNGTEIPISRSKKEMVRHELDSV